MHIVLKEDPERLFWLTSQNATSQATLTTETGTGEMTRWLSHLLLLKSTWVQFLAPVR